MKAVLSSMLAISLTSMLFAGESTPTGWMLAGDRPNEYSVALGKTAHGGAKAACFSCINPTPSGFGTLMQMFDAADYRGKRLRVTAFVKTLEVTGWAGLWMRVDGPSGHSIALDNMQDRPIKGTTDWTQYSVVLDVPERAQAIAFGVLLHGAGTTWLDDFAFEMVGPLVATTGKPPMPSTPQNLGFEE